MGRVKNWMMEMEELTYEAIEVGATNANDAIAYVRTKLPSVDPAYVKLVFEDTMEEK